MNVSIVNVDQVVMIDGEGMNFDLGLDASVWAIQWDGAKGHVEYSDDTPNLDITDFSDYEYLLEGHAAEKARLQAEAEQAESDRIEALTYADHRAAEYPEIGDQLDMQYWDGINGTTTWADAIKAVKDKYPKG
jgi:hypothetical protein